jgi:hypothetical protein
VDGSEVLAVLGVPAIGLRWPFRLRFSRKASALGPLFNWTFGTFGPFLDPLFGGCF